MKKLLLIGWILIWTEYKGENKSKFPDGCLCQAVAEQKYERFNTYCGADQRRFELIMDGINPDLYEVKESTR